VKLALIVCLLFVGCARPWTRPNTTDEQLKRDRYECERDMKEVGGQSFFFERCMFSKGYTEE
jgi:hypothetical protein